MKNLASGDIWISKKIYDDAETAYYENAAKSDVANILSVDVGAIKFIEKKVVALEKVFSEVLDKVKLLESRLTVLEKANASVHSVHEINVQKAPQIEETASKPADEDDDDIDLFASDSDEESAEAAKIREERLAAYAAKKSKKPALIAKSNIILDVKPWDDETDMKVMEENVRKIQTDGLLWGAAKLAPLAFGIHKLQISCVVEDDKVSIDWLTEQIEALEDFVQSVDIAAFNKI
ncbi:probable elongation factor 1-delta isoform X2 [Sitophilus oryzae]|uniref:Probable elongation factor 1-delta isoform X2 n=1 Tax=Sitophilus oryzae TaxID=7048 RepID=A0A6J2X5W5_SITOR|nr:probable elongation factor 1-delta isoform X2 [Sitophilus oryzae]XP_030746304.1 probable elongation factor 1-delta isoform X2 [Sitophilus oryzae]